MTRLASCAVAALFAKCAPRERQGRSRDAMADADPRPQRRLVEPQVLRVRRRRRRARAGAARPGRRPLHRAALRRRATAAARSSARRAGPRAPRSGTPARSPTSADFLRGHERRPRARRRRPSRRPRRAASSPRPVRVDARRARGARPPRARSRRCTSRTTSRRSAILARAAPGAAAGRLLRHGVPPQRSREVGPGVRAAGGDHRARRAALRLPRPVVRVHRAACCRSSTPKAAARPDDRRAPRQRRQHVRDGRRAGAWPARWASPPSTGCRWARAAATSIPA